MTCQRVSAVCLLSRKKRKHPKSQEKCLTRSGKKRETTRYTWSQEETPAPGPTRWGLRAHGAFTDFCPECLCCGRQLQLENQVTSEDIIYQKRTQKSKPEKGKRRESIQPDLSAVGFTLSTLCPQDLGQGWQKVTHVTPQSWDVPPKAVSMARVVGLTATNARKGLEDKKFWGAPTKGGTHLLSPQPSNPTHQHLQPEEMDPALGLLYHLGHHPGKFTPSHLQLLSCQEFATRPPKKTT